MKEIGYNVYYYGAANVKIVYLKGPMPLDIAEKWIDYLCKDKNAPYFTEKVQEVQDDKTNLFIKTNIHMRNNNFYLLDKDIFKDTSLSWGALGLYAFLCSFKDGHDFTLADFRAADSHDTLHILLNELASKGYLSADKGEFIDNLFLK
jgi:hypothetical protein